MNVPVELPTSVPTRICVQTLMATILVDVQLVSRSRWISEHVKVIDVFSAYITLFISIQQILK